MKKAGISFLVFAIVTISIFSLMFIPKQVSAVGPQLFLSFVRTPTVSIGNTSGTLNLTLSLNNTGNGNATLPINITLLLPYGITNNSNTDCQTFTFTNKTTNTCVVNLTGLGGIVGLDSANTSNRTVSVYLKLSNIAYKNYTAENWTAQAFCANCSSGNSANITNTTSITGNVYWINPRPYLNDFSAAHNSTFAFDEWTQIRSYYEVWVPLMTYNSTANRPNAANNSFANVIFADKAFFSNPTIIEMWGYRLNFTIYHNGSVGTWNTTYDIYTPFLHTGNQTLIPLITANFPIAKQSGNTSTNFSYPAITGFMVWYNGTQYTDTSLYGNFTINVSYNSAYGRVGNMKLLTVTAPSNRSGIQIGNISISILFSLTTNDSTSPSVTSPVYVGDQVLTGFNPDSASATPNGNINTSYYVRLTNPLANYTVTDLRLKFLVPLNVTTTNLTSYDNTTYVITAWGNMNVTWKMNNTDWEAGKDVFISQSNFSFVDSQTGSPTNNYNITVVFRSFEINLSYSNFSNWDPTSQNAAGIGLTSISNITANMTANMFFPLINKTFSNSSVCSAGGKYFYNVTVTMANRGRLNLTSELGSCFNTDRENIVIKLDGVILNETANRTIGSLEVNDVESGAHTVAVSYSVKAAGAGSSGGGTTSSGGDGGGGAADTSTKETPLTKTGLFDLVPGVDSIFLIEDPEGVNRIVISARSFIIAASFTFTKLTELPKSITTPTGKVHSMFSLTKDNIKDTDISSLKIEFLVLKNYLKDNNLQKEQIKLMRYTTQWNTLPTTILSEDNKAIKYQATTPGTSYFAIATEEVSAQAPTTGEVVEEEPLVTKAPPTSAVWIIIIVLLILALVIFYIYKRKTTNKKA